MGQLEDNEKPVFLINGFLDGGKTSFINFTISEEYFHIDENTLLLVCEDGEVAYDEKILKKEHIIKRQITDEALLAKETLEKLTKEAKADRIVIEYNGMWDPAKLRFPDDWVLYQQITVFDGTMLDMYLNNMKAMMGPMLRYTELVIINRCDNVAEEVLQGWKRQLRPMLMQGADIVMENKYGEIPLDTIAEDLPFDVSGDNVVIEPENYGIWFFDARDYPERYQGKTVEFSACVMKDRSFGPGEFVPGRMAMTCCAADMTFLGFVAHYENIRRFKDGSFVHLKAEFGTMERKEYEGEGPYLEVTEIAPCEEIKDPVTF